MDKTLIVQTGSVPALLWLLRRHALQTGVCVVALNAENVRQYLRVAAGLDVRYFRDNRDAERILQDCSQYSRVLYLGGTAFPVLRRTVRKVFPSAEQVAPEQSPDWPEFLDDFDRNVRRDSVLLIQTTDAAFVADYVSKILPRLGLARPSINLLCSRDEAARWRSLHPDWRCWIAESKQGFFTLAGELRRQKFDAAIAFFTGDKKFNRLKLLLMATGARQKIAVNEHMQFLPARLGSLLYLNWQSMRHRSAGKGLDHAVTRVLFVQTWDTERTLIVLKHLREIAPFYKPKYTLLTREDHAPAFSNVPPIDEILSYPVDSGVKAQLKMLRTIRDKCFDGVIVTFTEEPSFRKLKLLPFVLSIRYKLIFNRHYDCFFLTPAKFAAYTAKLSAHRYQRLFRHGRGYNKVVIVQTWDDERTLEILNRLSNLRLFHKPRYTMVAREDKVPVFSRYGWIEEFITYPRTGRAIDYWRCLRRLQKQGFDAAVLALTEQPTYRLWKWIPFLAGIRSKLVFNRHLDCFFYTPGKFLQYWAQRHLDDAGRARAAVPTLIWLILLPLVRGILFPGRFFYLVTSVTLRKLARAYNANRPMS
jgi:ADP-heptose:LPS heptosyltransferase